MVTLDDKYTFKDFGLIPLLGHSHPITSNFTNKTLKIPGKAGEYFFGTEIESKPFSIPLGVIERDRNLLQQKLNSLVAFLFDSYGKPRSIKMSFDYEPDVYYTVMIDGSIPIDRALISAQFEIPFIAHDPYKYSKVLADEITWGSEVITFESHYLLGHEGSDGLMRITEPFSSIDVYVDGLAIKPIIEIDGTTTALSIYLDEYEINLPAFSDSNWVIDCDKYTVLKDGVNAFGLVGLRDFILQPGMNYIGVYADTLDINIRIKSRDKYI